MNLQTSLRKIIYLLIRKKELFYAKRKNFSDFFFLENSGNQDSPLS